METPYPGPTKKPRAPDEPKPFNMEGLVGHILLIGVLLSMALIVIGLAWNLAATGSLRLEYIISGTNLFRFAADEVYLALTGAIKPDLLVSMGILALMLTPYVRVLASMLYFWIVEHNWKYGIFTAVVLGVLTYSLFLR